MHNVVPEEGIEPPTYRLQGGCSTKLSYSGALPTKEDIWVLFWEWIINILMKINRLNDNYMV